MEHVAIWASLGGILLGMIGWLIRVSWILRGVSDVGESALELARSSMPRGECILKEAGQKDVLDRIDKNVAAIWARLDTLQIGERLTRIETEIEVIKKRMNGNRK